MVRVHSVDDGQCTIEAEAIKAPGTLKCRAGDGGAVLLNWRDIDVVRLSERQAAVPSTGWVVLTVAGDRIHGDIVGGDSRSVRVRNSILGEFDLSLQQLVRIGRVPLKLRGDSANRDEDALELSNGDLLRGAVARCRESGVVFFDGKEDREVAWAEVGSIRFAALSPKTADGLRFMVSLADGSVVIADRVDCSGGEARLRCLLGEMRPIDTDEIVSIETLGGRRTWLSMMEPVEFKMTPYFDIRWGFERDRNVLGAPLKSKGVTYARGVGLHSASRISYALDGNYERFRALVAVDDSAGALADVQVRILLDETVLGELPSLTADDEIKSVDVRVSGGRMLTIEVGFGKNADVQDRVNVLNAALIGK